MDTPTPAFLRPFEIREAAHRIHDPLSEEKLAVLGRALRLEPGDRLLDLACGSGEMLCTWARDHDVSGTGVDISADFIAAATARADELGVADRVELVHGDAGEHVGAPAYDVVSCLGATWIGGGLAGTLALMERSLRPGWPAAGRRAVLDPGAARRGDRPRLRRRGARGLPAAAGPGPRVRRPGLGRGRDGAGDP